MDDFQSHSNIRWDGHVGTVQYGGGDQSQVVMFFLKGVHNPARSLEMGSPQLDDKIFVRIHPPGERLNIIEREANDSDKRRFPMQWNQFRENAPQVASGTPIDLLFPASPATAGALKASGVFTVEQCAALSAHAIETIGMGAQQWCNDATRWLEVANTGVKASQLKAALDDKDREINSLKHTLDLVQTELNHLRENMTNNVTMEDVQRLMAQQGGGGKRGVYVPNANFDAQTSQINATHATSMLKKPQAKAVASPPRRARAKIQN